MKSLLPGFITLVVLSGAIVRAQDLTGTWQGTLQAGAPLRLVITVSAADGGGLKAMLHSIDQGGQRIAGEVALQGTDVRMSVPGLGATYEGTLSGDGRAITGTWSQGPGRLTLNLARATADSAWAIPEPPPALAPMAADAAPAFDVATIKPSRPGTPGKAIMVKGRLFSTRNTSMSDLVSFAYGLHARQITGGPDWIESEKYDVDAQPDGQGQPNEQQWKAMLRGLLADRFKLATRPGKKELQVYAILVGKPAPKLTRSAGDPNGLPSLFLRGLGVLPGMNATMADLAGVLQGAILDRPVVDRTGLPGRYDFTLTWTPDDSQFTSLGIRVPPPSGDASAPPGLFTAIQEQLGLKLESTSALVEVLVIDRVEKPSAN